MFENLRRSCSIQQPRIDGSDASRFLSDIGRACQDNVVEARAIEKRISEQYIKPMTRWLWKWLWNSGKRVGSSAHRRRWRNRYD